MKTIIPIAGKDPRFEKIGVFKPLIMIEKKPLIYHILKSNGLVLEKLNFIVLNSHEKKYGVSRKLKNYFGNNIEICVIEKETEGAPNTILEAQHLLDDEDILIDLGDVLRDLRNFNKEIKLLNNYSGIIPIDKKYTSEIWGYVLKSNNDEVIQLIEKSQEKFVGGATMGIYYFSRGSDFLKYTKRMISKKAKIHSTGLYYVGPVYNELIKDNKKIKTSNSKILEVLGSPEQIDAYIKKLSYNK